jgi:hypothetical protein
MTEEYFCFVPAAGFFVYIFVYYTKLFILSAQIAQNHYKVEQQNLRPII